MPPEPFLSRALGRRPAAARRADPFRAAARLPAPRRPDCPWCGSERLSLGPAPSGAQRRLRPAPPGERRLPAGPAAPDLPEGPAGGVPFDACGECGHVFRNPRPPVERPAPQPHEEGPVARRLAARRHRRAARALLPFPEPESWLDVGTGDGRFPAAAKEFFPYTSFDGVDADHRVVRAQATGRVEEAHVGRLTDPHIAARLRARYDVVSMLHHLERAPDPRAELRGALALLRPGGHLLLDVTGPHGGWWTAPARPAALHLPPRANIEAELRAEGCTTVTTTGRPRLSGSFRVLARRN